MAGAEQRKGQDFGREEIHAGRPSHGSHEILLGGLSHHIDLSVINKRNHPQMALIQVSEIF